MKYVPVISLERLKKIKKHFNQNRQTLDRGLNLRRKKCETGKPPIPRDDRWLWNVSRNVSSLFEQLVFPCCRHRHIFLSIAFPTIWRLSLGHLCHSDILPVSSNGGWSDARQGAHSRFSDLHKCLDYTVLANHIGNIDSFRQKLWIPHIK